MPICVEWQDEEGNVLTRYTGPPVDVWLAEHSPSDSCCLRFIDPWGDTPFNQQQIELLFEELRRVADAAATPQDIRSVAEAVAEFIAPARGAVHTYVKFIGD